MVRCSIKRLSKTIIFLVILLVLIKNLSYFDESNTNKLQIKTKSRIIFILSINRLKSIERLILFLNELHLSYIQYKQINEKFYSDIKYHNPSIIILDQIPNNNLNNFFNKYKINLLIFLNNKCQDCTSIKYSQMIFENVTYPTIDYNRNELKPTIRTTQTPFKIKQPNRIIKILKFENALPYFNHFHELHSQCFGLSMNQNNLTNVIIYVENENTLKKIDLMSVSENKRIYVSECLFHHWFIWPLMMDVLKYLTDNLYDYYGLNRHLQVDIDDIFLGSKSNDRLKLSDIQALIRSQSFIQNYISNFRYRLGFSGYYFDLGNDEENQGDLLLISKKSF